MVGCESGRERVEILGESKETARVWWEGVIEALVEAGPPGSLASLERWWHGMGGLPALPEQAHAVLNEGAQALLTGLELAHRSWPTARIDLLGTRRDLDELLQTGLVRLEQGFCVVDRTGQVLAPVTAELQRKVSGAMLEVFAEDPWGRLRASVLLLDAGAGTEADEQLARTLELAGTTAQRRDLWAIWVPELTHRDPDAHREVSLRSARRALALDDVDAALELAGEARRGLANPPYEAALLMGRAQLARGDIVGARVSLEKAREVAPDGPCRARSLASEAEAAFWAGELDQAEELASTALGLTPSATTRLRARNVLGRVLLARAKWTEAEVSFAEDEALASSERLSDALSRARVNRAVALLSGGQLDAASRVLEEELEEGQKQRRPRAIAIALSNLGVVAHMGGRYAQAQVLYERAIEACRELGDRLGLARPAANLAELRLELGMVDEAEQALRFAQCTLRAGVPASLAPLLLVLEAEIHLERGESSHAARCAQDALRSASRSSNGAKVGECCRLITRIALEDGNLAAAEEALTQSYQHVDGPRVEAECAWLEARLARARGEDASDLARRASSLARVCGEPELCRATATLEAEIALAEDDTAGARGHLRAARRALRAMTEGLSPALLRSVQARKDIRAMESLSFAIEQRGTPFQPSDPRGESAGPVPCGGFVGSDPKMLRLMAMVRRVAAGSTAPALIHGESGTGKELIAEAIHQCSDRRDKPLVKVNCAALVETLLLSELFGHEKGSFTGAAARRRGRFELADGGILFLDEIGDISPRTQVALLRVLQDGTFERVGGGAPLHADVRVVCATHRDLPRMVAEGTFREDLYYRLCGVVIEVPSLRERGQDLLQLATYFLQQIAAERKEPVKSLSDDAAAMLSQHAWPGNVRELQNVLRAATLFADGLVIDANVLGDQIHVPASQEPDEVPESALVPRSVASRSSPPPTQDPVDLAFESIRQGDASLTEMKRRIERECIVRALDETGGNITRAATLLGMKRPRLSQIIKELGLQKGEG
jgi:transcriptional regulator with GAF, ATPase, and Fis domain/tetratricopeptide (TPR) repeat protein